MQNDKIQQIIENSNIVEIISEKVKLTRQGKNFFGLCPFHPDTSPSMSVSPEKKMYKCFVCGNSGNVIHFISEFEKLPYYEAASILGKRLGIQLELRVAKYSYTENEKRFIEVFNEANNFYQYQLIVNKESTSKHAFNYLKSRLITSEDCKKFDIGYSPSNGGLSKFLLNKDFDKALIDNASLGVIAGDDVRDKYLNRLMFGIRNEYGDIVGFSARALDDSKPKYINSSESIVFKKTSLLYNYHSASKYIDKDKKVYICEGFMDVIALSKVNINNAVAIMGTSLTKEHTNKLSGKKVILVLDSDEAGIAATLRSIEALKSVAFSIDIVVTDGQKDPAETLEKSGVEALKTMLSKTITAEEFAFEKIFSKVQKWDPNILKETILNFSKYLNTKNQLSIDFYSSKITSLVGLSNSDNIRKMLQPKNAIEYPSKKKNWEPTPPPLPEDSQIETQEIKMVNKQSKSVDEKTEELLMKKYTGLYPNIKASEEAAFNAMLKNPFDFMNKMYTNKGEFLYFIHKPFKQTMNDVIDIYREKVVKNNDKKNFNSQFILEKLYNNMTIESITNNEDEIRKIVERKNVYDKSENERECDFLDWKIKSLQKLNDSLKIKVDLLENADVKSSVNKIILDQMNSIEKLKHEKSTREKEKK